MKRTLFKIMLLLAVIFMRIETTTAASCRHTTHDVNTSTAISASTDADKAYNFIHATLDKTHNLFSTLTTHDHSLAKELEERIQRNDEQNINFSLRLLLFYHSLREVGLLKDKECLYPSTLIHCVIPSCEYYVFAMRKILI
ncbi:hypothetical protein [Bacteroides mediterraneensis]|uniref:hypothetical protein n=1 Tax=Bacteroides mediterraneensis TaxID=1841856 RepID=UPI000934437A|nr:hypothetical protein [Bacteroides mediterraneensis]